MEQIANEKLATNGGGVNRSGATISEVVDWVESLVSRADMGKASARIRTTGLQQMAAQVAPGEPDDIEWLLENMDRLQERWARRNQGKPSTVKTYAARASATIREYLKWDKAPHDYVPPGTRARSSKASSKSPNDKGKPKATAKPKHEPEAAETSSQTKQRETPKPETRTFPLGEGRGSIVFQLPPGGVEFSDVKKFAIHVLTLAKDFDISGQEQAQVFAMMVRGRNE